MKISILFALSLMVASCRVNKSEQKSDLYQDYKCIPNNINTHNFCTSKNGNKLLYLITELEEGTIIKRDSLVFSEGYWVDDDVIEFKKYNGIADNTSGVSFQILRYSVKKNHFLNKSPNTK